jgi:hypothetical protein
MTLNSPQELASPVVRGCGSDRIGAAGGAFRDRGIRQLPYVRHAARTSGSSPFAAADAL